MAFRPRQWIKDRLRQRAQSEWQRLAARTDTMSLGRLRRLQEQAKATRRNSQHFLTRAQLRLEGAQQSADLLDLPPGTDWRWRPSFLSTRISPTGIAAPASGTRLGEEAAVWHDCPARALILRQIPNRSAADLAPYGLHLETLGFAGNYLSVSIDLPGSALAGLTRSHIVRLDIALSVERPISIYGRLNVGHGPNTDEMLRHLGDLVPGDAGDMRTVEFDLHYIEMNERRLEKLWLDIIFEDPQMNSVRVRDVFLSRHLRADV